MSLSQTETLILCLPRRRHSNVFSAFSPFPPYLNGLKNLNCCGTNSPIKGPQKWRRRERVEEISLLSFSFWCPSVRQRRTDPFFLSEWECWSTQRKGKQQMFAGRKVIFAECCPNAENRAQFIAKWLKIALIEPSKFLSLGNSLLTFFLPLLRKPPKFWHFFHISEDGGLVLTYPRFVLWIEA